MPINSQQRWRLAKMHTKHNTLTIALLPVLLISSCTKSPSSTPKKSSASLSKSSTLFRNLSSEPETLHPIRSGDLVASKIQSYVLDTLLMRNPDTYQWEPHLAKKWEVSKDNMSFTFTIRSDVKWHDGYPLTVQDVVFSFQAHKDIAYGGVHTLPYLENIESVEVLDNKTVRFKAHKKYFHNFSSLVGVLKIIPEHIYKDNKKKLNHILVGSGPYVLKKYHKGQKIILEQNKNWWGRKVKKDQHRIPTISFKFIIEENDKLIRMARGDFDFLSLSVEAFFKKTLEAPWNTTITKKEIINKAPKGYGFIAWNLTNSLFKNKDTRRALTYLANRDLMNKKFRFGKSEIVSGPIYPWSSYVDPSVKIIPFSPEEASLLLKKAGWEDTDKDGILDKVIDGQKKDFRFTVIYPNQDFAKYITIYQEDLKKSGIEMNLRYMDWSAFVKVLQEKKFEAINLGWSGGSIYWDPKAIWHSGSSRPGGNNFISYSNKEVDRLIDQGRMEFNQAKRTKLFRRVYKLIAEDYPYLFLFSDKVQFYSYSKKLGMKKDTYTYEIGDKYWQLSN